MNSDMSSDTSPSAMMVNEIQSAFHEQVSAEYKRRSGIGLASDQQGWLNQRYADMNQAVNELIKMPGRDHEDPEGSCASPRAIEQKFKYLVQYPTMTNCLIYNRVDICSSRKW